MKKKNAMVYKNSMKSTVTTKRLEAQRAEKAKHELKGRIWKELDSAQDVIRIRKNTKNGELETFFFACI